MDDSNPALVWAPDAEIPFHGEALVEISPDGVKAEWGGLFRAELARRPHEMLRGPILVVTLFGDAPRWVTTERDPRFWEGPPDPETGMWAVGMSETGTLSFQFPGQHVQSPEHLRASRFEIYLRGAVPNDTKVIPENLEVLRKGATLFGVVEGEDLLRVFKF